MPQILSELIDKFSKIIDYKANTQVSFVFLHILKESKKEIKKTIPFVIVSRRLPYIK